MFYLSFENSRCSDYVTEKLFSNAILGGAVPIVSGASREFYERLAPRTGFIHVDDFVNVQELADRINFLLKPVNYEEYLKYHEWRLLKFDDRIEVSTLEQFNSIGLCGLCNKLWKSKNKIEDLGEFPAITDLHSWWYKWPSSIHRKLSRDFSKLSRDLKIKHVCRKDAEIHRE